MNLPYLDYGLQQSGRTAIVDPQGTWTYCELANRADAVAARLGGLRGERVGLFLDRDHGETQGRRPHPPELGELG